MEERNYKLYVHISPSNKRYYGITGTETNRRWCNRKGYSSQLVFNRAINKYGWKNFEHIVLFDNLTKDEANLLEQCYIALYDTTNPKYGYNISLGGSIPSEESRRKMSEAQKGEKHHYYGKHFSEEHRRKISEGNKGKKRSEESIQKMREASKGRKASEETKKKMSESNPKYWLGKHRSEETRRKLSAANKGNPSPMKGKHHTEETREKISNAVKLKYEDEQYKETIRQIVLNNIKNRTPEQKKIISDKHKQVWANKSKQEIEQWKRNISEGNKGHAVSEETRKKIGEAHKGYKHTEEAKRKMREANKGRKQTQETIEKRREKLKGHTTSEETKKKISEANKGKHYNDNDRKVICIGTGVIYNSLKEAEIKINGKHTDCIGACCRGVNYTAYGYHWCYLEDLDNYVMPQPKMYISPMGGRKHSEETKKKLSEALKGKKMSSDNHNAKKVKCIELNLIFNSVADANEYLGKPRSRDSISNCARGKSKTAYGYHWEYVTEEQEEQVI